VVMPMMPAPMTATFMRGRRKGVNKAGEAAARAGCAKSCCALFL
jgi:hypothetical protein